MKKVVLKFLCVGLALIIFSVQAVAYSLAATVTTEEEITSVTNFDETEIYSAFTEVEQLISYVQANEGVTFNEMEANHNDMVSNVANTSSLAFTGSGDTPPIISAFLWGCIFNWVGMLVVGLTTDFNGQQITKSLWGCLLNSVFLGGGWGCSSYYGWGY